MQLCNKYFLKKREVISLDKSRIQQLLSVFLLTRASTQLGREFGVIFPHYFSSSSAGDCALLEYPIWLLLQYAKMNCLWRKITPLLDSQSFFPLLVWFHLGESLKLLENRHQDACWSASFPLPFLCFFAFPVIECSFIILCVLYFWDPNEKDVSHDV